MLLLLPLAENVSGPFRFVRLFLLQVVLPAAP